MKKTRFVIQVIAILLQLYFFIETIRLWCFTPVESGWFSMLFTLLVVIACEIVSFVDAILFIIIKRNVHSFIYLALMIVNAYIFMTMAYYNMIGTIITLLSYTVLFVVRIVSIVSDFNSMLKSR